MVVDAKKLGVDYMTMAGHKIYATKGVGILYICDGCLEPKPIIHGANQEHGRRAGTENVILCVGMGKAAELIVREKAACSLECSPRGRHEAHACAEAASEGVAAGAQSRQRAREQQQESRPLCRRRRHGLLPVEHAQHLFRGNAVLGTPLDDGQLALYLCRSCVSLDGRHLGERRAEGDSLSFVVSHRNTATVCRTLHDEGGCGEGSGSDHRGSVCASGKALDQPATGLGNVQHRHGWEMRREFTVESIYCMPKVTAVNRNIALDTPECRQWSSE